MGIADVLKFESHSNLEREMHMTCGKLAKALPLKLGICVSASPESHDKSQMGFEWKGRDLCSIARIHMISQLMCVEGKVGFAFISLFAPTIVSHILQQQQPLPPQTNLQP